MWLIEALINVLFGKAVGLRLYIGISVFLLVVAAIVLLISRPG